MADDTSFMLAAMALSSADAERPAATASGGGAPKSVSQRGCPSVALVSTTQSKTPSSVPSRPASAQAPSGLASNVATCVFFRPSDQEK